jgi:uncharacterized membrane protein YfcA
MKDWILPFLGLLAGIGASFSGLGGGFLVVPLLVALGFTAQRAVGTSFVAILIIALSSMVGHARLQSVDWKSGVLLGLGGVVGAQIGPYLLRGVSTPTFQKIFAVILAALAGWMFFKK